MKRIFLCSMIILIAALVMSSSATGHRLEDLAHKLANPDLIDEELYNPADYAVNWIEVEKFGLMYGLAEGAETKYAYGIEGDPVEEVGLVVNLKEFSIFDKDTAIRCVLLLQAALDIKRDRAEGIYEELLSKALSYIGCEVREYVEGIPVEMCLDIWNSDMRLRIWRMKK